MIGPNGGVQGSCSFSHCLASGGFDEHFPNHNSHLDAHEGIQRATISWIVSQR